MPKMNMGFQLEFKTNKVSEKKGEVMIFSVISGTKFWGDEVTSQDFIKALNELGDVDELTIRINSPGGAVNEAIAMRSALMKHGAKKTVDIEGSCCSAATLIACIPGAHVRMAKGSEYMIHRCSWAVRGHAQDMLSAYQSMINTDNDIADIYAERSGKKTREEFLKLMDATTWYNTETAMLEGLVDEEIEAAEGEEQIAACAVTEEVYKTMQAIYENVPEMPVVSETAVQEGTETNTVSNEKTAVAAGNSSENTGDMPRDEGGIQMVELKDATAEVIQQENPAAAEAIANAAVEAERKRRKDIMSLKPKGAKWDKLAEDALNNGKSAADFLQAVIAEQAKTGEEYLANRQVETKPADNVGAGDTGDLNNGADTENKMAKELADLAAGMNISVTEME